VLAAIRDGTLDNDDDEHRELQLKMYELWNIMQDSKENGGAQAKANVEEDPGLGAEPTVEQQMGPADGRRPNRVETQGRLPQRSSLPGSHEATQATEDTAEAVWEDREDETPANDDRF
jgi:hypothetical protein